MVSNFWPKIGAWSCKLRLVVSVSSYNGTKSVAATGVVASSCGAMPKYPRFPTRSDINSSPYSLFVHLVALIEAAVGLLAAQWAWQWEQVRQELAQELAGQGQVQIGCFQSSHWW